MLYHITPEENLDSIQRDGLHPANREDSIRAVEVATQTVNRQLDKAAEKQQMKNYPKREFSVFFLPSKEVAMGASETGNGIIEIEEPENTALFYAERTKVEQFYQKVLDGVREGSTTNPAYSRVEIEEDARRIIQDYAGEWNGEIRNGVEVWMAKTVNPSQIKSVMV